MALIEYRLEYGATYATCTNVASNVQQVTVNAGRQRQLDQYNANTASITLRYPTGYASPEPLFVTGTWVFVSVRIAGGSYTRIFTGKIADLQVNYGIPYAAGVGVADFVTLSCEGNFAILGRSQGNNYSMAANTLQIQTGKVLDETGQTVSVYSGYGAETQFPATTISGTWGDWINRVLLTMNGRMNDVNETITLQNAYLKFPAYFGNFSDVTNNSTLHSYDQIQFSSYADNYYTQVSVAPESYTAQIVQTGSKPFRTYQVNTLNNSTGQALDYANYLLSTYSTRSLRIESVTCNLNGQNGDIPRYGAGHMGCAITIAFRGTTFQAVLEGVTYSGTPENASATYYFSSQDLNNYLILDDAVYGKLDNNKLGY